MGDSRRCSRRVLHDWKEEYQQQILLERTAWWNRLLLDCCFRVYYWPRSYPPWHVLSDSADAGSRIDNSFFHGKYRSGKNIGMGSHGGCWPDKLQLQIGRASCRERG